jgi:hypothetical protein
MIHRGNIQIRLAIYEKQVSLQSSFDLTCAAADPGNLRIDLCGLAPFAQTLDGTLRLWAERVPQKDIHASLALLRDSSGLTLVGGALLTPATPEQIGGVKVGPGLNVTEDGTLSVDMASEEDVAQMLDETLSGGKAGEEG